MIEEIPEETKEEIIHMCKLGASYPEIAGAFSTTTSRVRHIAKKAGLPHRKPGRKCALGPIQHAKIKEEYLAGASTKGLGKKYGLSSDAVGDALRRVGVVLRPPRFTGKLSAEDAGLIAAQYEAGISGTELARGWGVTAPTIYRILKIRGIAIRDQHGRPK